MSSISDAIVITGGAGGIGQAVARLVGRDSPVVLLDRASDELDRVSSTLRASGFDVHVKVVDLAEEQSLRQALDDVEHRFQPLGLVHSAGFVDYRPASTLDAAAVRRMLEVHAVSLVTAASALRQSLSASGRGRIVAVGSQAAAKGSPMHAHYALAKSAIEGYVRSIAQAWAGDGITCNVVAPGPVETPMLAQVPDEVQRAYGSGQRPPATPDEVAQVIDFLLRPGSSHVNGTTIPIDGGFR